MPFSHILDPEQLAILTGVINDICHDAGIEPDSGEYEDAAYMVMRFYWAGYRTDDQLRAALHKATGQESCG
jgi:hypothetical protein